MVSRSTKYTLQELKNYAKDAYCPVCGLHNKPNKHKVKKLETYVSVGTDHTTLQVEVLCREHGHQFWSCVI